MNGSNKITDDGFKFNQVSVDDTTRYLLPYLLNFNKTQITVILKL